MKKYFGLGSLKLIACTFLTVFLVATLTNQAFSFFNNNITSDKIKNDLVGNKVGDITDDFRWKFADDEPKYIDLLDVKYKGENAVAYIYIRTINIKGSSGREGKLRLVYEYAADEWNLIEIKPIKFSKMDAKYAERLSELVEFPLHFAAYIGDIEKVREELEKGTPVDNREAKRESTALVFASSSASLNIVKLLISEGADPNTVNNAGSTPLIMSVYYNRDKDITDYLIRMGADVNAKGSSGRTALFYAQTSRVDTIEAQKLLLNAGADINAKSKFGTPLIEACRSNKADYVRFLLASGADTTLKTDATYKKYPKMSAFDIAEKNGHTSIVELFKNHGK